MNNLKSVLLILFVFQFAQADEGKVDPALINSPLLVHDIMVYLKDKPSLVGAQSIIERNSRIQFVRDSLIKTARVSQTGVLALAQKYGLQYHDFYIENAVAIYAVPPTLIQDFGNFPEVQSIRPDTRASLKEIPVFGQRDVADHLEFINVLKVWSELKIKGKGIVVGGQDSGVYVEHNALKKQYRGNHAGVFDHNYNWHDAIRTEHALAPIDDDGHGTHTMGTMVGFDGKDNAIGVAPEAKWIACKNMSHNVGTISSYLECFEFMMAPYPIGGDAKRDGRPQLAPHIVNNSWACPTTEGCRGDELLDAVRAMRKAGIFVVAAAGNNGPNANTVDAPPATYTHDVFSVGAYNRYTQDIAIFSSRGPSIFDQGLAPQICAPGEIIHSSVPGSPDQYDDKSGTSMASPQIAGVVALIWSAHPELIGNIEQTIQILQKSAKPMKTDESGAQTPNNVFGFGIVDAFAALKLASGSAGAYSGGDQNY